jgi:hypothetical protein
MKKSKHLIIRMEGVVTSYYIPKHDDVLNTRWHIELSHR